ncbi:MAG: radical SAM family heme chaperone HemW [Gammaproteobacteria bacterium]|nr:radical SAM family heme chaperone HemW [Gammaproteobacteria bacterium]
MNPTSLYIHIPWCIRKCPYCDFNSHKSPEQLPEMAYIDALLADFDQDLTRHHAKKLHSIFIGGGTPSLLSADAYERLMTGLQQRIAFEDQIEITLEANPGTLEHGRFSDYRALGINRLSLGIQSFNPHHLKTLGRIHDDKQAHHAIEEAQRAGFTNLNLDLMHGLPGQTVAEALDDLEQALHYHPKHLSWYQLTIEPNTIFHKTQPKLPHEEISAELEEAGMALLAAHQFQRYEISAFCQENHMAQHNMNYWLFGDYYGIGAGAHGKLSLQIPDNIYRTQKYRQPKDYLDPQKPFLAQQHTTLSPETLIFEFMLNTTRLEQAIEHQLFTQRTGLNIEWLLPQLQQAEALGLLICYPSQWQITPLGRRFTNDLQALFLT